MSRSIRKIFNIPLASTSRKGVLKQVANTVSKRRKIVVFTPNPEIVLHSYNNKEFSDVLCESDLLIPDGIGLAAASTFLSMPKQESVRQIPTYFFQGLKVGFSLLFDSQFVLSNLNIIKGRELFIDLISLSNEKKWRVYLLGSEQGVARRAAQILSRKFPRVEFKTHHGPLLSKEGIPFAKRDSTAQQDVIHEINEFKPHLLFVGFGHPKQEKWIIKNKDNLKARILMTVGGTFDYIADSSKQLPSYIPVQFEWLWRLVKEPKRIGRIINAVMVFPFEVFKSKFYVE